MTGIRAALQEGPLVFDGAMGTLFAARPGCAGLRCELANLERPDDIRAIHRAYLDAGCMAIKTNTFAASAPSLEGDVTLSQRIVEAGCHLAQEEAARRNAFVFADLGPIPQVGEAAPAEEYLRMIDQFLALGLRHFLVETLASDQGVAELAQGMKARCPDAYLIVSYAVQPDGSTREGRSGEALFRRTAALPAVDAVGFNCVSGPHHLLEYIKALPLSGVTLSVMPNAGYPTVIGSRTFYGSQPDYFGAQLSEIVQAGAAIVGGCCGTTPEHMAQTVRLLPPPFTRQAAASPRPAPQRPPHDPREGNPFWEKLQAGRRVIAVELDPPADGDPTPFLEGAKAIWRAGADVVTVADCPVGRPRADSSLLACMLKRELGIEPLPHLTCRDRNLNATKALLLGLSMSEVHNVLLVTGDPIPSAARDEVKSVFNFNSRMLARYVSNLNESVFQSPYRICGALNLNALNFDVQLRLAAEKEQNGVSVFLTQPVLSLQALENLRLARNRLHGKILGGIFPVVSYRNAVFLNNEVSGISVCDEILSCYREQDRTAAEALAVEISTRIASEMLPYTDGFYLMTPFRRVALVSEILSRIRMLPCT